MAWTEITRPDHDRRGLRYASDATDAEWRLIAPCLEPRSNVARPRKVDIRDVRDAIQYIAASGCPWRWLPTHFPPVSTVQHHFYRFRDEGVSDRINDALAMAWRVVAGRDATPTAGIIDSQSVKTTEGGGPRGYDAGKRTKGTKRHIVTETEGNLPGLVTHTADIQDRDGAKDVIEMALETYPTLAHIFADGGYSGDKLRDTMADIEDPEIESVKRPPGVTGCVVIARRWVLERPFARLGRCRPLAKDCERSIASARRSSQPSEDQAAISQKNRSEIMKQTLRVCGHLGFSFGVISASSIQNGGLNPPYSSNSSGKVACA